jgi:hypothetical protein
MRRTASARLSMLRSDSTAITPTAVLAKSRPSAIGSVVIGMARLPVREEVATGASCHRTYACAAQKVSVAQSASFESLTPQHGRFKEGAARGVG